VGRDFAKLRSTKHKLEQISKRERERESQRRRDCSGESVSGWYVESGAFGEGLDGRE
jgi:hypothetical protein